MKEFRDDQGRPWQIALTVAAALRVRDMVNIEIDQLDEEGQPTGSRKSVSLDIVDLATITQTLQVVRMQFAKLGEVLYAILMRQVEDRNMTKDQFLEGLRGDSLEAASKALEEELVDFFPLRLRKTLGLIAAKMTEVAGELMTQAEQGLESVSPTDLSGTLYGKPQQSSGSTQENGRSGSCSSPDSTASSTIGGTPPTSLPSKPTSTNQSTRQKSTQPV